MTDTAVTPLTGAPAIIRQLRQAADDSIAWERKGIRNHLLPWFAVLVRESDPVDPLPAIAVALGTDDKPQTTQNARIYLSRADLNNPPPWVEMARSIIGRRPITEHDWTVILDGAIAYARANYRTW